MNTTCTTCCRPLDKPYRSISCGRVVQGCVAADHNGHVSDEWHTSPEAERIRQTMAEHRRKVMGE